MNQFRSEYYLDGPRYGLSNYVNYSWQGEITVECVSRMMAFLGAEKGDSVHDFGCALGFYVKAAMLLGYSASGHDISSWAIEHCDPMVKEVVSTNLPSHAVDWILCKDVLEHIPKGTLHAAIQSIIKLSKKGALIIVPLTGTLGAEYLNPSDCKDSTHVIAWPLPTWLVFIQTLIDSSGGEFVVSGSYRLPGVKEAAASFPCSTGFITLKRV